MRLLPGGRRVEYRRDAASVVRSPSDAGGNSSARETYYLPQDSSWHWEQAPGERGRIATLAFAFPLVARQTADRREGVKCRTLAISAVVGRDLRWEMR